MTALDPELQEAVNALFTLLNAELAAKKEALASTEVATLDRILFGEDVRAKVADATIARLLQQNKVLKMLWPYCTVLCSEIE